MLFVNLIIELVRILLFVLEAAMFVRAILSWFPIDEDNKLYAFLCMLTEPLIHPIRVLFERMNWFQNTPLDVAYFVAYLILIVLSTIL